RRRFYTNIPMNVFVILNVITTQSHRRYINVPMNVSPILNVITTQLGTSCSFDSPGLARNEPTPGKHSQGDSTP
ncbi:tetrahydrofolate synthase, partial [Segatella salivae]